MAFGSSFLSLISNLKVSPLHTQGIYMSTHAVWLTNTMRDAIFVYIHYSSFCMSTFVDSIHLLIKLIYHFEHITSCFSSALARLFCLKELHNKRSWNFADKNIEMVLTFFALTNWDTVSRKYNLLKLLGTLGTVWEYTLDGTL